MKKQKIYKCDGCKLPIIGTRVSIQDKRKKEKHYCVKCGTEEIEKGK